MQQENYLYITQQYEEAIILCDLEILVNPQSQDLWRIKARCLHQLERYEEAVAFCDLAIKFFPESISLNFIKVRSLYELYEYEAAIAACYRFRNHVQFGHYEGLCLYELKIYDEAHEQYRDRD